MFCIVLAIAAICNEALNESQHYEKEGGHRRETTHEVTEDFGLVGLLVVVVAERHNETRLEKDVVHNLNGQNALPQRLVGFHKPHQHAQKDLALGR